MHTLTKMNLIACLTISSLFTLGHAQAAVVTHVQESFDGTGGLNGTTVDVSQSGTVNTWFGQNADLVGGELHMPTGGFGKAGAAFEDAGLSPGITRMEIDLRVDEATVTDTSANVYFGFGNGIDDGGGNQNPSGYLDNSLAFGFRLDGDFANGTSLTLRAGAGPGNPTGFTNVGTFTRPDGSTDFEGRFAIEFNNESGAIGFYVQNVAEGDTGFTLVGSDTYSLAADLGGIWFKGDGWNGVAGVSYDNLIVTHASAVPEPTSLGLILMGGLMLSKLRRNLKK